MADPLELVTVVIPTHNRKLMVREAVDSVLAQRFDAWRLIIVDNDSTDGTSEMIESLGHPRIEFIRQPNLGPSGGRNTGIARARTPWIAFLDSDDSWKPDFLEVMMKEALARPHMHFFAGRGELYRRSDDGIIEELGATPAPNPNQTVPVRLLRQGNFFPTSTVLARTEAICGAGGFDTALPRSEDTDLWLRLALRYEGVHLPHILVRVRLHSDHTQVEEDRLEKLGRRIYICKKALASPEGDHPLYGILLRRRLRIAWRERAKILAKRQRFSESAAAFYEQWMLRPLDPRPLFKASILKIKDRLRSLG